MIQPYASAKKYKHLIGKRARIKTPIGYTKDLWGKIGTISEEHGNLFLIFDTPTKPLNDPWTMNGVYLTKRSFVHYSPYWVTMTDKFFSGWGQAEGKTNKLILECESMDEAEIVEANAHRRNEMKHINICVTKPHYKESRYYVSYHTKEDYQRWYQSNQFGRTSA